MQAPPERDGVTDCHEYTSLKSIRIHNSSKKYQKRFTMSGARFWHGWACPSHASLRSM